MKKLLSKIWKAITKRLFVVMVMSRRDYETLTEILEHNVPKAFCPDCKSLIINRSWHKCTNGTLVFYFDNSCASLGRVDDTNTQHWVLKQIENAITVVLGESE